jgi:hypothetical protein
MAFGRWKEWLSQLIARSLTRTASGRGGFLENKIMNDHPDQGDTGPAQFDLTLLIVKCAAAAALLTAAAWLVITYALDWVVFR